LFTIKFVLTTEWKNTSDLRGMMPFEDMCRAVVTGITLIAHLHLVNN